MDLARAWAGPSRIAMILGGSHAAQAGVWATVRGRTVTLSDLDVYAVVPSPSAARDAEARRRAELPGLSARLLGWGIAAPLEVGFFTPDDLRRLPARPATIELARHARVVEGDPTIARRIPAWSAADVPLEEVLLLLENRAFDLIAAWPDLAEADELARLKGRHAVLKAALDLAGTLALAAGEWPDGARARVTWAEGRADERANRVLERTPQLPGLWREALAWREGRVAPLAAADARAEWHSACRGWAAVWMEITALTAVAGESDPYRRAVACARRARLRRRARQAVSFRTRSAIGPTLASRLAFWSAGTPQHRLNATAAILLLAAARDPGPGTPTLGPSAVAGLAELGFGDAGVEWERAARGIVRRWDEWILDGQRTAAQW